MKHTNTAGRVLSVGIAAAAVATLTACGSSSNGAAPAAVKPSPTAAATGKITADKAPKFIGVQHPIPSGAALANTPDLYKYVAEKGCAAIAGGWEATGTAQNVTKQPLTFKVLVLFTDAQARIVDSASTTATIPASSKGTWTAQRQFKAPKGTRCVVRAVTEG